MDDADRLRAWLGTVSGLDWVWFAKRLSANDTGATGGHQVGLYVPKEVAFDIAPDLREKSLNPRVTFSFFLASHGQRSDPALIYYNSRVVAGGTRNECRITGFGGRASAVQDVENTGALLFLAFRPLAKQSQGWIARSPEEEVAIEESTGPVEPGEVVVKTVDEYGHPQLLQELVGPGSCSPSMAELPEQWVKEFPHGQELTDEAARRAGPFPDVDRRIMGRYRCEFSLFRVVEKAHTLPLVSRGFKTVDEFLAVAQAAAQRRKARAGRALELQLKKIFDEEHVRYSFHASTELGRVPDFVFPSIAQYDAASRSGLANLRMLAVKTTLKDRWRQVLDEAAKLPEKHLFTIAEGVSVNQYRQMVEGGIRLVIPAENHSKFPIAVRSGLLNLETFVRVLSR